MIAKLFHDATCSVEGCDRAVRLEFDHRDDWARVMVTELANLDLLCDHHHDKKTYENWQLIAGTGRRPMVPPTDPRHPDQVANPGAGPPGTPPGRDGPTPRPDARPTPRPDGGGARVGGVLNPELAARIARISHKEAEHQARLRGQNSLFEPG